MNSAWRPVVNLWLLSAILFYTLLPTFGLTVWHRVVPEHDHWFVGANATPHAHDLLEQPPTAPACADCDQLHPSDKFLHLPGASGALPMFDFVVSACLPFVIPIPPGWIERVPAFVIANFSHPVSPPERPPIVD